MIRLLSQPCIPILILVGMGMCVLPAASAQDASNGVPVWDGSQIPTGNLMFENIGSQPINATCFVFDSTEVLFAGGSRGFYHFDGGQNSWILVKNLYTPDGLLALSPDTLLADERGVERSLDGGQTWTEVFDDSAALYQTPDGLLLSGQRFGPPEIVRSEDRGDTWEVATFADMDPPPFFGDAFLALPEGHPHAGRLIAGGGDGLAYSDDNGATWIKSGLWQQFRYIGYSLALTESGRILSTTNDNTMDGMELYGSDDGGETWTLLGSFVDPEGWVTKTFLLGNNYGYPLEDGSLWVTTGSGLLWRNTGNGETWTLEGMVPDLHELERLDRGRIVGPDGRLYLGIVRGGVEDAWVRRTVNSIIVANEPPPEAPGEESSLHVYPNPSSDTLSIEADPAKETAILYDVRGREVLRAALADGWTTLHTGSLPAGVYVVAVGGDSRRVTIAR